jgi:hypothetical protein
LTIDLEPEILASGTPNTLSIGGNIMAIRGWVYVLTNRGMPGLVKIGFSTKDPHLRANELEGTGLPHPYVVEYDALVIEPRDVEQAVHRRLQAVNERKEFFRTDVVAAVKAIHEVIASKKKEIITESYSTSQREAEAQASLETKGASRVVLCPKCRAENRVVRDSFVCHMCRELHSVPRPDDDLKSSLNPAAAWPFPTGSRPS